MKPCIVVLLLLLSITAKAQHVESDSIKIDTVNSRFHKYSSPFDSFQKGNHYRVVITDSTIEFPHFLMPPTVLFIEQRINVGNGSIYFLKTKHLFSNFSMFNYYHYPYKLIYTDDKKGKLYCIMPNNTDEEVLEWTSVLSVFQKVDH